MSSIRRLVSHEKRRAEVRHQNEDELASMRGWTKTSRGTELCEMALFERRLGDGEEDQRGRGKEDEEVERSEKEQWREGSGPLMIGVGGGRW